MRILTSNCDFLAIEASQNPLLNQNLKAYGSLPSCIPNKDQPPLSILQILQEPLGYNPEISGFWGNRTSEDPSLITKQRQDPNRCRILRISTQRKKQALYKLNVFLVLARSGITHFFHLITDLDSGTPAILSWQRYKSLALNSNSPFITKEMFKALIQGIPRNWLEIIPKLIALRTNNPRQKLIQIIIDQT